MDDSATFPSWVPNWSRRRLNWTEAMLYVRDKKGEDAAVVLKEANAMMSKPMANRFNERQQAEVTTRVAQRSA